ncbi:MAG: hypothetical protein JNG84_11405 [Archangium sp.]|nr:hypothetical protein [Archangium sp.]
MPIRFCCVVLVLSAAAHAVPAIERTASPFEHRFGFGAYVTGSAGAYSAGGVGGRIRVELTSWLGTDFFGEALLVSNPGGLRHDHPIGFNLFVPFSFGRLRVRPLAGMCVTFSFIEPLEPGAPRADDVIFGVHLGAGLELALHQRLSFFVEGKGMVWVGHDRAVAGWTGSVDNDISLSPLGQAQLGLTVHL